MNIEIIQGGVVFVLLTLSVWKILDLLEALIVWAYRAAIKHRYRQKGNIMDARNMSMDEYGNPIQPICEWTPSNESSPEHETGRWETSCGHVFYFSEGGPADYGFDDCPYCRKLIEPRG